MSVQRQSVVIVGQVDESQVLVQPADAVYSEVGKEHGDENEGSHGKVVDSETSENYSMKVQLSDMMFGAKFARSNSGSAVEEEDHLVNNKKAKLSKIVASGSAHPLKQLDSSPELPHKLPTRPRQEGNISDEGSDEVMDGVHTNLIYSIEGKSSMDREEEDWGGRLEFGFNDNLFPKETQDYFLLIEDECSTHSHNCGGSVPGVVFNMRDSVLKPPSYNPRNVVDLI